MKKPLTDAQSLAVLMLGVSLICVFLELVSPFFFLTDDNACQLYPGYSFAWRCVVETFTLPVVNFHQYLGQAFMAQGFNAHLYPPLYLAAALSLFFRGDLLAMMDILSWLHLTAGAAAMFLLLRCLKISSLLSFAGALLWATNPYLLDLGRACILIIYLAFYIPATFWLLEKFFQKPSFLTAIFLVLFKVMLFFQANVLFVFFLGLFELPYFLIRLWQEPAARRGNALKLYLLPHLVLPLLIAPVLLPLMQGAEDSFSRSQNLPWIKQLAGSINPWNFILAQFFLFRTFAFEGDNRFLFLGIAAIPMLLFSLPSKFRPPWLVTPNVRLYAYFALAALLLSTPLYALIGWIPPFSRFRWPYKLFCFAPFFAIVALALMSQLLGERQKNKSLVFIVIVLFSAANLLAVLHRPENAYMGVIRSAPQPSPFLEDLKGQTQRVMGYMVPVEKDQSFSLSYNFATLYGAYHFLGYDALLSKKAKDLAPEIDWRGYWDSPLTPERVAMLNSWSVRFLIARNSPESLAELAALGFTPKSVRGDLILCESKNALPLAVVDPGVPAPDLQIGVNTITAHWLAPLEKASALTLTNIPCTEIQVIGTLGDKSEIALPWMEKDKRIHLEVPQGTGKVVLRFHDLRWERGRWLFLLGLAYLALLLCFEKRRC